MSDFAIPPLVLQTNPDITMRLRRKLHDEAGDIAGEAIPMLHSIIPHLRDVTVATRIESLSPMQLETLSHVLRDGLQRARGWGGNPRKIPGISELVASMNLDLSSGKKDNAATRKRSSPGNIFMACRQRDRQMCIFTGNYDNAESCHILPHAVGAPESREDNAFWILLAIIFGQIVCDQVWRIIGTNKDSIHNAILMNTHFHGLYDKGKFDLVACMNSSTDQLYIDLVFHRQDKDVKWWACPTKKSTDPTKQIEPDNNDVCREICTGDVFRIQTTDVVGLPLPSRSLLNVRNELYFILRTTGLLAVTRAAKRKAELSTGQNDQGAARGPGNGGESDKEPGSSPENARIFSTEEPFGAGDSGAVGVDPGTGGASEDIEDIECDMERPEIEFAWWLLASTPEEALALARSELEREYSARYEVVEDTDDDLAWWLLADSPQEALELARLELQREHWEPWEEMGDKELHMEECDKLIGDESGDDECTRT